MLVAYTGLQAAAGDLNLRAGAVGAVAPMQRRRMTFPFRNFGIDQVRSRAERGSNHMVNLQLLCGAGNRAKGKGAQAELTTELKEGGQLTA